MVSSAADEAEEANLDTIMLSVVKIYCNCRTDCLLPMRNRSNFSIALLAIAAIRPNFSMPWQRLRAEEFTSSGFIIEGRSENAFGLCRGVCRSDFFKQFFLIWHYFHRGF